MIQAVRTRIRAARSSGAAIVVSVLLLVGCSSGAHHRTTSSIPRRCVAAAPDEVRRIDQATVRPGLVANGFSATIPDDAGFDAVVAARMTQSGHPIGAWALGSDGGVVAGLNAAADAGDKGGGVNPGSTAGQALHAITLEPQYAAVLACAAH